jgi:hypothetical protein
MDLRNWEYYQNSSIALVGASVKVRDAVLTHPNTGTVLATTTTDSNGMWAFVGLTDTPKDIEVVWGSSSEFHKWYKGLTEVGVQQLQTADLAGPVDYQPGLLNGSFALWQDGTTFTSIADGTFGPEHWRYDKVGAVVHDLLQSTDVPVPDADTMLMPYSCKLDVTTVDASIAAGDYCALTNLMEGWLWQPFAQRMFSLGFWVKAAKTGIHCVAFRNAGLDRSYVAEYTVNAANTWEYKTVTVPASPSAGTWDYTTGTGLKISFTQSCGSTFQTTAGAWQTGNFLGTANQVNETDNTANNFFIAGVGPLTLGPYPARFRPIPFPQEEMWGWRYFYKYVSEPIGLAVTNQLLYTDNVAILPIPMRVTPTISNATFSVNVGSAGTVNAQAFTRRVLRFYNQDSNWTVNALVSLSAKVSARLS